MACTLFLSGCNFRCGYCYNADLVFNRTESLSEEYVFAFLEKRRGLLEGVCITGGEPTVTRELPFFCAKIKSLGFKVKLDTNGSNPEMLKRLIDHKFVDYIAMDIKASLESYEIVTMSDVKKDKILASIALLLSSPVDYEFRTTIVPDVVTVEEMRCISSLIWGAKRYALQQFRPDEKAIGDRYRTLSPLPDASLKAFKEIASEAVQEVIVRNL